MYFIAFMILMFSLFSIIEFLFRDLDVVDFRAGFDELAVCVLNIQVPALHMEETLAFSDEFFVTFFVDPVDGQCLGWNTIVQCGQAPAFQNLVEIIQGGGIITF